MVLHKVAVISSSLGGFDHTQFHVSQSIHADYFVYREPLRSKAITPRLQAKIPKCFAWQLYPGYDYYVWLDGNISLSSYDALSHLLSEDHDFVVLRHPNHIDIRQETRYTRKGIKQKAFYLYDRYENEQVESLYKEIEKDKSYVDDDLYIGGVFVYKNIPEVQTALKEWFYYMTRYALQDQISFPYILRNLNVKVLPDIYDEIDYLKIKKHK